MSYFDDKIVVDFTIMGILNLRPGLAEEYEREFRGMVKRMNPITKDRFADLPIEQQEALERQQRGIMVWHVNYGLEMISGGKAFRALRELYKEYSFIAMQLARQARKDAGWRTGPNNDYRITPEGKKTTWGGYPIGRYAMPYDMYDMNGPDFDGAITEDTRFTL